MTTHFPSVRPRPAAQAGSGDELRTSGIDVSRDELSAISAAVREQSAYSVDADRYASRTRLLHHWRQRVLELLGLRGGEVVLDVGCGSGLCFELLQEQIGPKGTIVGIDASPDMLDLAARLISDRGWDNVVLLEAPAEQASIPGAADAVLFCAVHDVLQSSAALGNLFAHTRPGARIAAVGGKWAPSWAVGLNAVATAMHAPFVRDFTGFDQPWGLLRKHVPDLRVREIELGCGYLASGTSDPHTGGTAL